MLATSSPIHRVGRDQLVADLDLRTVGAPKAVGVDRNHLKAVPADIRISATHRDVGQLLVSRQLLSSDPRCTGFQVMYQCLCAKSVIAVPLVEASPSGSVTLAVRTASSWNCRRPGATTGLRLPVPPPSVHSLTFPSAPQRPMTSDDYLEVGDRLGLSAVGGLHDYSVGRWCCATGRPLPRSWAASSKSSPIAEREHTGITDLE